MGRARAPGVPRRRALSVAHLAPEPIAISEPGYEEEGIFKKDKKEGIWRIYNLTGDLIAVELYKLGGKDGIQQYYTYLGDLVREESWRGYNPDAPYDTIPIYGAGNNEILNYKIVKAEQYSVKHGEWKYYDPANGGRIVKVDRQELFRQPF